MASTGQTTFFLVTGGLLLLIFSVSYLLSRWALLSGLHRLSELLRVLWLSALWFLTSSTIIISNREVFGRLGPQFSLPFFFTAVHMLLKSVLSALYLVASPAYLSPDMKLLPCGARQCARARKALDMQGLTRAAALRYIVPMALATAADVALSNLALKQAGVAVYTVAKSTSLVWTMVFSLIYRLAPPSPRLIASVLVLALGVCLCAWGTSSAAAPAPTPAQGASTSSASASSPSATALNTATPGTLSWGAGAAAGAALAAGTRWVLSDAYISREGPAERPNMMLLLTILGPISAAALTPAAAWELSGGWGPGTGAAALLATASRDATAAAILAGATLGIGALAFALVLCELLLVECVGALSVNVISHGKDAAMVVVGVAALGEELGQAGALGAALALCGAGCYSVEKGGGCGGRGVGGGGGGLCSCCGGGGGVGVELVEAGGGGAGGGGRHTRGGRHVRVPVSTPGGEGSRGSEEGEEGEEGQLVGYAKIMARLTNSTASTGAAALSMAARRTFDGRSLFEWGEEEEEEEEGGERAAALPSRSGAAGAAGAAGGAAALSGSGSLAARRALGVDVEFGEEGDLDEWEDDGLDEHASQCSSLVDDDERHGLVVFPAAAAAAAATGSAAQQQQQQLQQLPQTPAASEMQGVGRRVGSVAEMRRASSPKKGSR